MIEAGSIGIKAVWSDQEARQSADRFYADMKRKRDEFMSGSGVGTPGAAGTTGAAAASVSASAWRSNITGLGGGAVNASAWRQSQDPIINRIAGDRVAGNDGAFLGGGFGGGGGGGGGAGGASGPAPTAAGRGFGVGGRAFGFVRPLAAAYLAIRGVSAVAAEAYRAADQEYISRTRGSVAGLEADAAENQRNLSSPIGRLIRSGFSRLQYTDSAGRWKSFGTSDEDTREAIDRARESVKDVEARRQRIGSQREAHAEVQRITQQGDLSSIRDTTGRRMAEVRNAYDNLQMQLNNKLAGMRDELAASTNPSQRARIQSDINSTRVNNALIWDAAGRTRAAEEARIRSDAHFNAQETYTQTDILRKRRTQRGDEADRLEFDAMRVKARKNLKGDELDAELGKIGELESTNTRKKEIEDESRRNQVRAAGLEYRDRPGAAAAQRIYGKTKAAFEGADDMEDAADQIRIGRYELLNMQKEITRRGTAQSFDPRGAGFGVKESGKEDIGALNGRIGELIKTINTWMPGLK